MSEPTGRDRTGEIAAVRQAHQIDDDALTCRCGWEPPGDTTANEWVDRQWHHQNDAIVAALGLRELEQTIAAQGDEIDAADAEVDRLTAERNGLLQALTELRRAPDPIAMERDAARRDLAAERERLDSADKALKTLRGEVWVIANSVERDAVMIVRRLRTLLDPGYHCEDCEADARLRAALAASETGSEQTTDDGPRCQHTDHDLSTNRRLVCAKAAGHDGPHGFVFQEEVTANG